MHNLKSAGEGSKWPSETTTALAAHTLTAAFKSSISLPPFDY